MDVMKKNYMTGENYVLRSFIIYYNMQHCDVFVCIKEELDRYYSYYLGWKAPNEKMVWKNQA